MAKSAKVNITGINQTRDQIQKFLQTQIKDKDILEEIGKTAADQIRSRTRGRQETYKQDPLKQSTEQRRKELIAAGNSLDGRQTRYNQSNLTLSGQLLDAISYRINVTGGFITIFMLSARRAYVGLRGKNLENQKTNIEIKNDLENIGRKFFFISERLNSQLQSKIIANLRRKLSLYKALTRK